MNLQGEMGVKHSAFHLVIAIISYIPKIHGSLGWAFSKARSVPIVNMEKIP